MNKYDAKILEIAPNDGTIHELIRRPIRKPLTQLIDLMVDNILYVIDGFTAKGSYYLLLQETKANLVHIKRNLEVSYIDVTTVVQIAANKNAFEFDGYKYKLLRKIR